MARFTAAFLMETGRLVGQDSQSQSRWAARDCASAAIYTEQVEANSHSGFVFQKAGRSVAQLPLSEGLGLSLRLPFQL